jgi:hypothetical protein
MDEIRIPNSATYSPVSLLEVGMAAPVVGRLLLRSAPAGLAIQAAALALYGASVVDDWLARTGVRRIDFPATFGADVRSLPSMPVAEREEEVRILVARLNAIYTPERIPRRELARVVDARLTEVIAAVTGQRIRTSTEIRGLSLMSFVFPFAHGTADILSGEIAILKDTGILEPHVIVHELAHRKGYWKELHAQVLAYLALASSDDPMLLQAALAERLTRQLTTLAGDDRDALRARVRSAGLIEPIERQFVALRETPDPISAAISDAMRQLYDLRMRVTGQNGLSDYDAGFTAFLWALERGVHSHRAPTGHGRVWTPDPASA